MGKYGIVPKSVAAPSMAARSDRFHFLDASRAIMLLLGIPMHVGEVYRVSGGWKLAATDTSFITTFLTMLIHAFRMPAFFILSGFFAAMIIGRSTGGQWLMGRALKLGIPLIFASLLLAPLEQMTVNIFKDHMPISMAFIKALSAPLETWINHRWFLLTLLMFCLTLFAILLTKVDLTRLAKSISKITSALGPGKHISLIILLAALSFGAIVLGKIVGDKILPSPALKQIVIYYFKFIFFFILGVYLFLRKDGMREFVQMSRIDAFNVSLFLVLYGVTYFAFYPAGYLDQFPLAETAIKYGSIGIELVTGYYAARLFFSLMSKFFDNENKVLKYFVEASYSVYLFHMVFVLLTAGLMLAVDLPPLIEFFVIVPVCTVASLLCFELIRRSNILSWIFNGGPAKQSEPKKLAASI